MFICISACSAFSWLKGYLSCYFQWDFVCDKSWMKATISSIYIAGMGIGGFVAAWFSDRWAYIQTKRSQSVITSHLNKVFTGTVESIEYFRFGRKKVILVAGLLNMVASLSTPFSPLPAVFYVFRFFHAGLLMGSATSMFVLGKLIDNKPWLGI